MSGNFWANKMGAARPADPVPGQAVLETATATRGPWWAAADQRNRLTPEVPPDLLQPGKPPVRAQVSKQDTYCSECGGDTFFRPMGNPNAMGQCYECGFNSRFQQTTAGLPTSRGGEGESTPSKQTGAGGGRGGQSNYHPETIVDTIR